MASRSSTPLSTISSGVSSSGLEAGRHIEAEASRPTDIHTEIRKLYRNARSWQAWKAKTTKGTEVSIDKNEVFVVEFPDEKPCNEQSKHEAIPGTELVFRCPADRSNELAVCIDKTIKSKFKDKSTEEEIITSIKRHRKNLHEKHTNLSEIRLSKVKSRGYGTKQAKLEYKYCIVLVVSYKGLIPLGEEPFPSTIDGFPTDVWEGKVTPLYHPASHQAFSDLRMGASIEIIRDTNRQDKSRTVTIGPFIKHKDKDGNETTNILSVAHSTVDNWETDTIVHLEDVNAEQSNICCFQPTASSSNDEPFGKIVRRKYDFKEYKDAALIKITNQDKMPTGGDFPDTEDSFEMFYGSSMVFASGRLIRKENAPKCTDENDNKTFVVKYGATTGPTKGYIVEQYDDRFFEVKNDRHHFCQAGDSGSLVLLVEMNDTCQIHTFGRRQGSCSCKNEALGIIMGTNGAISKCLYISDCLEMLDIQDVDACLSFPGLDSVPPLRQNPHN